MQYETMCSPVKISPNLIMTPNTLRHLNVVFSIKSIASSSLNSYVLKYNDAGMINSTGQKLRCVSSAKHRQHSTVCLLMRKQKNAAKNKLLHTVDVCPTQLNTAYGLKRYANATNIGISTKSSALICNCCVPLAQCLTRRCCATNWNFGRKMKFG